MPIYEYICEACNETYDALQKMSDAPLTVCKACGKPQLKKKLSAPSFRLSGSGWYETDFKSGSKKNVADSGSSSTTSTSTSTSTSKSCGTGGCSTSK